LNDAENVNSVGPNEVALVGVVVQQVNRDNSNEKVAATRSSYLVERLLRKQNQLSRQEKDIILGQVLQQVLRSPRWWQQPKLWVIAVSVTAATVVATLTLNRHPNATEPQSEFAARGKAVPIAAFSVRCSQSQTSDCKPGDNLVIDLNVATGYQYFAALTKHDNGEVTWYFPATETDQSIAIQTSTVNGILQRRALLGTQVGRYQMFGFFSMTPLSRESIKANFRSDSKNVGADTAVVVQGFQVQ
jgi:hypothetical protein